MKILCLYLPQYHVIPENSNWWGEGYTEWDAVKNAKPLYRNHYQPKIPLDNNYYDLDDESANTWKWQAKLAKEYSVYGFCIYHYWFNGKQLLERPMEILLYHEEININYCICWANETWTRTWYGLEKDTLILQEYGVKKDWKIHFDYLLDFFKDPRYIKINNKPMLNIYNSSDILELKSMIEFWSELAIENGFDGIYIVACNNFDNIGKREEPIDAYYNSEPGYTFNRSRLNFLQWLNYGTKIWIKSEINKLFTTKILERKIDARKICKMINNRRETTGKIVFKGLFPMWDNSPRRGYKGTVYTNTSPKLFYDTLLKLQNKIKKDDLDFLYVNAWNEWGEGAYLEPDENNGLAYLEAIKSVLINNNEQ